MALVKKIISTSFKYLIYIWKELQMTLEKKYIKISFKKIPLEIIIK